MDLLKILGEFKHNLFTDIIKAVLNLVLVSSMTYSVMNVTHPALDFTFFESYEECILFFLDGSFAIPFGVFILLWFGTEYLGRMIFGMVTYMLEEKARKRILNMSFDIDTSAKDNVSDERKEFVDALMKTPSKHWGLKMYEHVAKSIPEKQWTKIKQQLRKVKQNYSDDFVVVIRALIMSIVYVNYVDSFGRLMFFTLLILFIVMCFLLVFFYLFASALPLVDYVMRKELDKYNSQANPKNESESN